MNGTKGLAFDSTGKLWCAGYKDGKNYPGFLAAENSKGKFPYRQRVAKWKVATDGAVRAFVMGPSDAKYLLVYDVEDGASSWTPPPAGSIWVVE